MVETSRLAVETVTGPAATALPGIVDAHAHVWIDTVPGVAADDAPALRELAPIKAELAAFRDHGGAAVVDCQPPGAGRNLERLFELSRATGVAIVAATGFHLSRYHGDAWPWSGDGSDAADRFAAELIEGVSVAGGRRIRPGVIKVAYTGRAASDRERDLIDAACVAATRCGALIVVHTERGLDVEHLVEHLAARGMAARKVMLSHVDKRPDLGLHRELAAAGHLLEYDTFLRPRYDPDTGVWPLLEEMFAVGHADSIACALDLADRSLWGFGSGGPGMLALPEVVTPRLRRLGATASAIRAVTGGNVWERLAKSS